jgi:hypothetical protein
MAKHTENKIWEIWKFSTFFPSFLTIEFQKKKKDLIFLKFKIFFLVNIWSVKKRAGSSLAQYSKTLPSPHAP